jgi:hypothetical protein
MVAATFHPRSAKSSAAALPIPLEAPVMRTVLVVGSLGGVLKAQASALRLYA